MEFKKTSEAVRTIADHYGKQHQLDKTIEEAKELIEAISNHKANLIEEFGEDSIKDFDVLFKSRADVKDIISEIADVLIMLFQLIYLAGVEEEVYKEIIYKLTRQLERMKAEW